MGKPLVTDEQAERLHTLLEDLRFHPERIAALTTPEELHAIACVWNWDDSATVRIFEQIISHPRCDLGTASLIFDLGEFLDILTEVSQADSQEAYLNEYVEEKEYYSLALAIIARANGAGFLSQKIRIPGLPTDSKPQIDLAYAIPEAFFQATPGEEYEYPRNVWM